MKLSQVVKIFNTLSSIKAETGLTFNFFILDNLEIIQPTFKKLAEQEKRIVEILKPYNVELQEVESPFLELTEKGEKIPVEVDGKIVGVRIKSGTAEEYNKALNDLQIKHHDLIEKFKVEEKELNDYLDSESTLELHKIESKDLPTNSLSTEILYIIKDLINR